MGAGVGACALGLGAARPPAREGAGGGGRLVKAGGGLGWAGLGAGVRLVDQTGQSSLPGVSAQAKAVGFLRSPPFLGVWENQQPLPTSAAGSCSRVAPTTCPRAQEVSRRKGLTPLR